MAKKRERMARSSGTYTRTRSTSKNNGKSKTVPGQSEPLDKLLGRIALQQDVPFNTPSYEEVLGADIRNMDKVERAIFAQSVRQTIAGIQQTIQLTEEEKAQAERDELEFLREEMKRMKAEADRRNADDPKPTE